MKVLASISTKNRYTTTLHMAILSVISQTRAVDKLVIFDDSDVHEDLRTHPTYAHLFELMNRKHILWEWVFAGRKGQHHNHQMANQMALQHGYECVWRVDDDCIADPQVLENLCSNWSPEVGAVGGSVLTPSWQLSQNSTGKIAHVSAEPSIQWGLIDQVTQVDHLHCTFMYRAGAWDYNLALSKVAHREETLFTWGIKQRGLQVKVIPHTVTWHLKSESGGIRSTDSRELYAQDDQIFQNFMHLSDKTIVVLDCGMGDHVVFKHVLPKLSNVEVFSCYPQIIPGKSIAEAKARFGDIDAWNVYKKMHDWHWKTSLQSAFEKLYGVEKSHAANSTVQ